MKKLVGLLVIMAFAMVTPTFVNAQTYQKLTQARAQDTIIASQILYTPGVSLNTATLQAVMVTVKTSTVSGTPDVAYTIQRSGDGVNWWSAVGDTMTYSATVTKYVTINPFYGAFIRVKSYTGGGAQKTKSAITLKSWDIAK